MVTRLSLSITIGKLVLMSGYSHFAYFFNLCGMEKPVFILLHTKLMGALIKRDLKLYRWEPNDLIECT